MTCFYCKGRMQEGTTVFTVQLDTCLVVIKNVPCLECSQCGETEIADETMVVLERIIDTCKKLIQEVAVVDYRLAA
ncbi:MAG: type II toxin-antitoxin system MqsA family antitoxin [Eggerthellaceae bacterium]|nr:type II toxin-antitoxin system MqsA family antitoxin [Eggerthellaceae bacterium]